MHARNLATATLLLVFGPTACGGDAPAGGSAGVRERVSSNAGASGAPTRLRSVVFDVAAELASEVQPTAPGTVGIVTWSTNLDSLTEAHVEFGLDTSYGMTAPVDLTLPDYRTLLLGMKPEHTYHYRVVASDGDSTHASSDFTLTTGPKPALAPLRSFSIQNATRREPGFIVASFWEGPSAATAFILDADGDVVWWYQSSLTGIARAKISADAKNLWFVTPDLIGGPLWRVSMDTLDVQSYDATLGSHDICAVSGETMAYIDYGETDCDSIFEIDPSGTTREVFESEGIVSSTGGSIGCHGNAVRYSPEQDVYTYSDWQQDVIVVDRRGQVAWRLSDKVSAGNASWGGEQHGHQLLDDGLLIFANQGAAVGASQAIEYSLDGRVSKRFSSRAYSQNMGDVQRLPGGNTLITYAYWSLVQEVDEQDEVVLELIGDGGKLGYIEWRDSLYGAPTAGASR